jgi:hypothetical protein
MSMPETRRQLILYTVDDLALSFAVYDRKEDEELPSGAIEEAIAAGEITVDEIAAQFHGALISGLSTE